MTRSIRVRMELTFHVARRIRAGYRVPDARRGPGALDAAPAGAVEGARRTPGSEAGPVHCASGSRSCRVAGVDVEMLPADLAVPEGLSRVAERLRRGVVWGVGSCRVGGVFPVPCDCFVMCGSVLSGGGRWGRSSYSAVLVLGAGVRGCE